MMKSPHEALSFFSMVILRLRIVWAALVDSVRFMADGDDGVDTDSTWKPRMILPFRFRLHSVLDLILWGLVWNRELENLVGVSLSQK